MGCKGSKHALHGGVPAAAAAERRMCSSRRSVAVRSAAVSFAAGVGDGVMLVKGGGGGGGVGYTSATVGQEKRCRRAPPRTPTKTPLRAPEEINVWELMAGLDYDEEEEEEEEVVVVDGHGGERQVKSAPGSPAFDPDVLAAFRKAVEELPPESPPRDAAADDDDKKGEIQKFPGVVRARIILFQKEIDAKLAKKAPPPPPPPPESARRVVVYLTSLRGIRQTYEDCCATASILRSYGVRVDERDLSLHAGYKDELRAALGDGAGGGGGVPGQGRPLPQVFVDGCHVGGAEDVRRMHESGELTGTLLKACDTAAAAVAAVGKGGRQLAPPSEPCGGCGGVRFVPCDACSGSCKVFVADDEDGGAFRRCPECNENGLVRCPVC
uniref:Glutaredoxin domain-containing protein n=1 Tax=Oryza nivara TaxID=4536 RepID=A0A0E0HMY3_ORYNI